MFAPVRLWRDTAPFLEGSRARGQRIGLDCRAEGSASQAAEERVEKMPSFDVVSEVNAHELANAVDQANRELETRFDFRGSGATIELSDFVVILAAPNEFQVRQMRQILTDKLGRRKIDVGAMKPEEPEVALNNTQQRIVLRNGIDSDHARKIVKSIKDSKLKVQASIQGEQVRVTGKKRDDLQAVMQLLKKADLGQPLQFTNFRD
jgi:uncharacterized protein YajQ (UPF0234 family)